MSPNVSFFFLSFYLFRCLTSYERAHNTSLHNQLMKAIMHIASLEAHTTLNIYNLWKLAHEGDYAYCKSRGAHNIKHI